MMVKPRSARVHDGSYGFFINLTFESGEQNEHRLTIANRWLPMQ